jgi:hypothetical protein
LEICLEDRLQYELERTLYYPIPNRRNRKDQIRDELNQRNYVPLPARTLPPSFGISCFRAFSVAIDNPSAAAMVGGAADR